MYVSKSRVLLYVLRLRHNAPHPNSWLLEDPQKVIHIDTILILVYTHTYSKRNPTEAPHPEDEDGPWEEDQEEEREELSDDDPPTSDDDGRAVAKVATGTNADASGVSTTGSPFSNSAATNQVRRTIPYTSNSAPPKTTAQQ